MIPTDKDFNQQHFMVRDEFGYRYIKCDFCGKIGTTDEFIIYGGINHLNGGKCYDCKEFEYVHKKQMPHIPFLRR